jgi:hypothetical protein
LLWLWSSASLIRRLSNQDETSRPGSFSPSKEDGIHPCDQCLFWPFDGRATRNNCRRRRIASHKNRMTSASAASGAAKVRSETRSAPPSSAVAMTRLPRPPVKTVDDPLSIAVTPCVRPATPPPAITAAVHFSIGGRSGLRRDSRYTLSSKQLELLRELVPQAVAVAVFVNPASTNTFEATVRDVKSASRAM